MRTLRKIFTWLVRHWGFPGNLQWWWDAIRPYVLPSIVAILTAFLGWWRDAPFYQVAIFVIVAFVVLYFVVLGIGVLRARGAFDSRVNHGEPDQPRLMPANEDLRQRCCNLSAELSELIGRWQNAVEGALQPGALAQVRREVEGDPDGLLEIRSHDSWLMKEYGERFGVRVLKLSDELAQHRCIIPETRKRLESPEKPKDVQYIAQRLKLICGASDFDPQEYESPATTEPSVAKKPRELGREPGATEAPTDPHKEKAVHWEKRRALYKLLNDLHEEGSILREADYGLKAVHGWEIRADQLIEAALGKERAASFRVEDPSYAQYGDDIREGDSEGQIRLALLLHRLKVLRLEISSLTPPIELQEDFDPQRYES